MWSPKILAQTFTNLNLRLRLLHLVRILVRWPSNASYGVDVAIIMENTFVRKQNVFGKMIIFFTYIKELPIISQFASFIINMQLLSQSYFVGMEVNRF